MFPLLETAVLCVECDLFPQLVVVLGCESSVETLERVVSNEEVNWGCVLTLVATLVTAHHATIPLLKGMRLILNFYIVFYL